MSYLLQWEHKEDTMGDFYNWVCQRDSEKKDHCVGLSQAPPSLHEGKNSTSCETFHTQGYLPLIIADHVLVLLT